MRDSATSQLLGKEANSTCFRQRPQTVTQIEGFSWPNHKPSPETIRRWALKDEDVVVEALSSLGSSSKQSNSGGLGLRKRWLQPLDEQTSYYPQVVKDASASLRNSKGEPKPTRTGYTTKAPGAPEAFEFWSR
jgi:hypothetical protein